MKTVLLVFLVFLPFKGYSQFGDYIPNALLIPVHSDKQQVHLSLGVGGGYNIYSSYSFTKHLALFATGTKHPGTARRVSLFGDRINIKKNDYALTGGFGYFFEPEGKRFGLIETYLGVGKFKVDSYWYFPKNLSLGLNFTEAEYWNLFWQINSTKRIRHHEWTKAFRFAYTNYTHYLDFDENEPNYKLKYRNLWGLNIDPAINYSYILNRFKLSAQVGISFPLTSVTVKEYRVNRLNEERLITNGTTRIGLLALFAQIGVKYTFDLKNKAGLPDLPE